MERRMKSEVRNNKQKVQMSSKSTYHRSCLDIFPCSQVHSSPPCRVCCSHLLPSPVHMHTAHCWGHKSYYSCSHICCYNPCHSGQVDSVSRSALLPSLACTNMLRSQGHTQCCCHHDNCRHGYIPGQTSPTHTCAHTVLPCSPVHMCRYLWLQSYVPLVF